eukprot:3915232-Rhodomonas_salina.1
MASPRYLPCLSFQRCLILALLFVSPAFGNHLSSHQRSSIDVRELSPSRSSSCAPHRVHTPAADGTNLCDIGTGWRPKEEKAEILHSVQTDGLQLRDTLDTAAAKVAGAAQRQQETLCGSPVQGCSRLRGGGKR